MDIDLNILIDKALSNYDECSIQYKKYIDSDNVIIDRTNTTIKFIDMDNLVFKYNILGIFDNENNIWIWAWMIPQCSHTETIFVKKLLNYGLKIDTSILHGHVYDKLYIKTQLVNSRFLIEDNYQLELQLAISHYLAKDNIKFIYPRIKYLTSDKTKFITYYYLIY